MHGKLGCHCCHCLKAAADSDTALQTPWLEWKSKNGVSSWSWLGGSAQLEWFCVLAKVDPIFISCFENQNGPFIYIFLFVTHMCFIVFLLQNLPWDHWSYTLSTGNCCVSRPLKNLEDTPARCGYFHWFKGPPFPKKKLVRQDASKPSKSPVRHRVFLCGSISRESRWLSHDLFKRS